MEKKAKLRISISFEQEDGQTINHEGVFEMLDSEIIDLDSCEQHLLSASYAAMREALSKQFSELSKKKV